jgi:hypothetical protein
MAPSRTALALLVVGVVLLPGPGYAVLLEQVDGPERQSTAYVVTPIDASNDSLLTDRYADRISFRPERLTYGHVADDYRAPNRTRDVLERAVRSGTATTSDEAVAADLRRIGRDYAFLTIDYDEYYAFSLSETNKGDDSLRTSRANESDIAATVRHTLVVDYRDLSPEKRETVRKIRNATEAGHDYHPWSDEPVPERRIVRRNGTSYAIETNGHVDEFGPSGGVLLGFAGSAVGIACLFASGGVWVYGRMQD